MEIAISDDKKIELWAFEERFEVFKLFERFAFS